MITQQYINGYIAALNALRYTHRMELLRLRKDRAEGLLSLSEYKCTVKCTLKALKSIIMYKNDYKALIARLNRQSKIIY